MRFDNYVDQETGQIRPTLSVCKTIKRSLYPWHLREYENV